MPTYSQIERYRRAWQLWVNHETDSKEFLDVMAELGCTKNALLDKINARKCRLVMFDPETFKDAGIRVLGLVLQFSDCMAAKDWGRSEDLKVCPRTFSEHGRTRQLVLNKAGVIVGELIHNS